MLFHSRVTDGEKRSGTQTRVSPAALSAEPDWGRTPVPGTRSRGRRSGAEPRSLPCNTSAGTYWILVFYPVWWRPRRSPGRPPPAPPGLSPRAQRSLVSGGGKGAAGAGRRAGTQGRRATGCGPRSVRRGSRGQPGAPRKTAGPEHDQRGRSGRQPSRPGSVRRTAWTEHTDAAAGRGVGLHGCCTRRPARRTVKAFLGTAARTRSGAEPAAGAREERPAIAPPAGARPKSRAFQTSRDAILHGRGSPSGRARFLGF